MIGNIVTVKVDRPMGSYHPKHKDIYYPINYGYIEGMIAPDGEEQDAYLLGLDEPVQEYTGIIIAIIHRYDDVEEKMGCSPERNDIYKGRNQGENLFSGTVLRLGNQNVIFGLGHIFGTLSYGHI